MTSLTRSGKALVIIPYFGKFGPWFPLYLHSLGSQHTLDLLLVTDARTPNLPRNAHHLEMTLSDVRHLAQDKLRTEVKLVNVRKLCDLKPAYGMIFCDYIRGYDYWAFGDEDVIYGDLDNLLAHRLQIGSDFIIPSRNFTVGHLTLVRNETRITELVMEDPVYITALASEEHWAYDEWSWARNEGSGSFTNTIRNAEKRGAITVNWGLPKRGDLPWRGRSYTYHRGSIHDNNGNEIAYYHWGRFRRKRYEFPTPEQASSGFAFDRYGFYDPKLGPTRRLIRRALGEGRAITARLAKVLR
jgi:hypothetical protein